MMSINDVGRKVVNGAKDHLTINVLLNLAMLLDLFGYWILNICYYY